MLILIAGVMTKYGRDIAFSLANVTIDKVIDAQASERCIRSGAMKMGKSTYNWYKNKKSRGE